MIISERIFIILKERKIKQKEFSQMTGISQSTISDWKHKKTNPAADKIMKICNALELTPYELLVGREDEGVKLDVMVLNKDTDEYMLVEGFRKLDKKKQAKMMKSVK